MKSAAYFFLNESLSTIYRVLGLTDRIDGSATFGCTDRTYWHYKLIDFPNLRFQESGLLFALAYSHEFDGNRFFRNRNLLAWSQAVWEFWLDRRNSDGSAAEVYPNERSFCATAFSALGFLETQRLLGDETDVRTSLARVEPTMKWLSENTSRAVSNQTAAAFAALHVFADMTSQSNHRSWARRRRDDLLSMNDSNGVFPEYGGFDAGYQSITLSLLGAAMDVELDDAVEALRVAGKKRLVAALSESPRSLSASNSRRTQYVFPSAVVGSSPEIITNLAEVISGGAYLRPSWMDDRYCIGLASDFMRAGLAMNT